MTGGMLWAVMLAIGAVTYLTRAIPLLSRRRQAAQRAPAAWLEALGPCILGAIAVSVLVPEARGALGTGAIRPFALGALATAGVMLWRRDAGLATVAGVAAYWLAI